MGSWPALFYGSEVMPNLWAALFARGDAGLPRPVCDRLGCPALGSGGHRTHGCGHGAHATTGCRGPRGGSIGRGPGDARIDAVDRGRDRGGVGGHAPLVDRDERSIRRASRSHRGRTHGVPSWAARSPGVAEHLRLTDGPLLGPEPGGAFPWVGVLWWVVLIGLSAWALRPGADRRRTLGVRVAAVVGVALAAEYLFLVSGPRAAVPVARARGALRLGRRRPGGAPRSKGVSARGHAWWLRSSSRVGSSGRSVPSTGWRPRPVTSVRSRRPWDCAIGDAVGEQGCVVASTDDFAQVAFAAGCAGQGPDRSRIDRDRPRPRGRRRAPGHRREQGCGVSPRSPGHRSPSPMPPGRRWR